MTLFFISLLTVSDAFFALCSVEKQNFALCPNFEEKKLTIACMEMSDDIRIKVLK